MWEEVCNSKGLSFCPYNYVPWETSAEFKPKQTNRTGDWTLLCRYVNSSS